MKLSNKHIATAALLAMVVLPALALAQSGNPFEPAEAVANEVLVWIQRIGMIIASIMIVVSGVMVFVLGKADTNRFIQFLIGAIIIGVGAQVPAWISTFAG